MIDLPQLVRTCYLRDKGFEILGGGEQAVYRGPDGRTISNWDLIRTPTYEAFKQGFRDGFEGRKSAGNVDPRGKADYEAGVVCGRREREKQR